MEIESNNTFKFDTHIHIQNQRYEATKNQTK